MLVDPLPKPAPLDLGCDRCTLRDCPDLPLLISDRPDGSVSSDGPVLLSAEDGKVHAACRAVIQACTACIQRGRDKGVIR